MDWALPAAIQALINLVAITAIGLAAFGKLRDGRFQSQKDLIQLRGEQVDALGDKVHELMVELEKANTRSKQHEDLAEATEASLRAEIAQLQKININMQKQMDQKMTKEEETP